jgi:hypothetical protein
MASKRASLFETPKGLISCKLYYYENSSSSTADSLSSSTFFFSNSEFLLTSVNFSYFSIDF